ncbi:metal-dependent hydrolase [Mycolicibacter arupensis]|jgi:predicted metal-dependent hydrolase|uniref:Metal-dependent hydrolase n=1 Tax=Mycolicibacter arupensis TaxID=342002 RepID=A0A0F5MRV8_9MYCO|nr:metal-dependent hydrolase [Mycolicibacter arupensis]KAA1429973.1 metal-dependent hydrolase [Mycolicibacter arupensis]KKB97490.1 metal-dependent hydrolase [Mycolicibacter arupensis]MCV7274312.1 metal-dependent hydrolase [Mycolicibacter arupensis]OQZ91461.1 metal-dependent hydrolase [Mycolicibacter arupensis]TXI56902.1 MAG: metal-dependent hydrolase [Mycolicibacter arupensis]
MLSVDDTAAGPHSPDQGGLDHERIVLQARDVGFDWSDLPVHYVPGEPFVTHFCDVLHLLLPAGEEFFVEVFKQALPLIKDDQLRLDVQGFIGQEAMHSQAHTAVVDHLAARGVDMSPFTSQISWLFAKLLGDRPHWSERRQQRWLLERIALVAAVEHYTAILGEWILDSPALDEIGAHPVMLDMLRWHGAEEVEHKAVAFDVMKHLRAGYLRQVRTQLAVTPLMLLMWVRGLRYMYTVDPLVPPGTKPRWRDWFIAARRGLVPSPFEFLPAIASYYRPGFHPAQLGGVEMAVNYLAVSPAARATH